MKLGKKLVAAGLITTLAMTQTISAFAANYSIQSSFGGPNMIGDRKNYSINAIFRTDFDLYMKAEMKVDYYKNGVKVPSYYVSATSTDNNTRRTTASAFKTWTDSGSELNREYDQYYSYGYTSATATSWSKVCSGTGLVSSI